jgi:hypothetical protein
MTDAPSEVTREAQGHEGAATLGEGALPRFGSGPRAAFKVTLEGLSGEGEEGAPFRCVEALGHG